MRKVLLFLMIFLFHAIFCFAQYDSIYVDGHQRTYLLHLPSNYSSANTYPLVIAMHGGFGNAQNLQNQSELSLKSDEEDFLVVYPEGLPGVANVRTWNAGWCCGWSSANEINDVGFIDALLDTLIDHYAIDLDRIYATGMSNGGFMSYRLACELSHRIAAIAPVACSISVSSCTPERAIPILQVHSYQDTHVPYLGGIGSGPSNHYNPPHDSVLNAWAIKNACTNLAEIVESNNQYDFTRWSDCDCASEIHYYITQDGGHSWAGGNATIIGDPSSEYINATDLMWSFFQEHRLTCTNPNTAAALAYDDFEFTVFPNPSTGIFQVKLPENLKEYSLVLYDQVGKKIMELHNENRFHLRTLLVGLYYLSLETERFQVTEKIIIFP